MKSDNKDEVFGLDHLPTIYITSRNKQSTILESKMLSIAVRHKNDLIWLFRCLWKVAQDWNFDKILIRNESLRWVCYESILVTRETSLSISA